MSPRVRPKLGVVVSDKSERERESAARAERARLEVAGGMPLDMALRKHDVRTAGGLSHSVRERGYYGASSQFSFFRDLAASTAARAADDAGVNLDGRTLALLNGTDLLAPHPVHGTVEDVRHRLRSVEMRALTTTATQGGDFLPPGPSFIAEQFATAARAASKMTQILPRNPLPEKGIFTLTTPRITTGDTVAVQITQNVAPSGGNTDLVESNVVNPVATITGFVDVSQQLLDHSEPNMDLVLATELGRAYGTKSDQQLIEGTGANGQMLGLIAVTGITANTYTDSSATQAEAWPTVAKLYSDVSTAVGDSVTAICLHPRRRAWLANWKDSATGQASVITWPAPVREVPAISTANGAATNEDFILALRVEELPYYATDPVYQVGFDQTGSGTLTVRLRVYGYLSALFTRRPEAIGKLSGTGLSVPVFS